MRRPTPNSAQHGRIRREAARAFAQVDKSRRQVLIECVVTETSAGGESISFPHTSYLGSTSGGIDRLGLLHVNDRMRGWAADWMTNIYFAGGNILEFGLSGGGAHGDSFFNSFDPGPGASLPIAGPNGGLSGFLLGAWPLNIATNLHYSAELTDFGLRLGYGKRLAVTANTSIIPKVFIAYSRTDFSESFSGSIPGFARDFRYMTDVDVNRYGIGVGLGVETRIGEFASENDLWDVAVRYAGEFAGFRVSGSGHDSLDFTGFLTSTQALDKSETDWDAKLYAGIFFHSRRGIDFGVHGSYERRPGYPEIVRSGTDPSELQFHFADIWSIKGSFRLQFGGGMQ